MRGALMRWLVACAVACAGLWAQPPAIHQESLFNEAHRHPTSLPSGALAPGARITMLGVRLTGDVKIRRGDRVAKLRVLSAAPRELHAQIPRDWPEGAAEIIATNADGDSRPFAVLVVDASFGIYAEGKKWAQAKLLASPPGTFTITGTGLGKVRDPEVWLGGKPAKVLAAGPLDEAEGTDQIRFAPAADAAEGCHVPVIVRLGNGQVSNSVAVAHGRCNEATEFPLAGAGEKDPAAFLMLARVFLRLEMDDLRGLDVTQDIGFAGFAGAAGMRVALNPWRFLPPAGTCLSYTGPYYGYVDEGTVPDFFAGFLRASGLDAGAAVTVRGAQGALTMRRKAEAEGVYQTTLGVDKAIYSPVKPLFLGPGEFRVAWPGSAALAGGEAALRMPGAFQWSNIGELETVQRAAGVEPRWSRLEEDRRMLIVAASVDDASTSLGAAICVAPVGARSFRVPPMFLTNVPGNKELVGPPTHVLLLATLPAPGVFAAGGVRHGVTLTTQVRGRTVRYR